MCLLGTDQCLYQLCTGHAGVRPNACPLKQLGCQSQAVGRDSEGGTPEVLKGATSELERAGLGYRQGVAQGYSYTSTGLPRLFVQREAVMIFALVSWPANKAPECTSVINSMTVSWLMF